MTGVQPMPCPVLLGTMKGDGLPALLHRYTVEKKVAKMEKILKKGVDVDSRNNLGQTPLFCACLLGFANVAEKLLDYGANPNHRCIDLSTPVHAAVFSCDPRLLSSMLDAGGDLRLHDDQGRTPRDWAEAGAQENSSVMIAFLKRCESQMQGMLQAHLHRDGRVTPTSSKTLLSSVSPVKLLRTWSSGNVFENKTSVKSPSCGMIMPCFGYGKVCVEKPVRSLGLAASVPLISDTDLSQTEDEPFSSFMCGSFISMTNYSWKGCRVSVKELHNQILHQQRHAVTDLLITEQEYCCQLSHPHLLLMMAVSTSADLNHTRLVYERVNMGSLFGLLHQKREEFPLLQVVDLLSVVLQVCDVLMYLHGRSLVLRALSSHTVLIVHPGVAKVTGLGFMVPSDRVCFYAPPPFPLPLSLVNWASPEVIKCKACTGKADIYSLCALIQEIFTDAMPWGSMDQHCIKKAIELGQALIVHPAVPQPYYQYLETGLQHRAQDRTNTLQDLCYMLRCDITEIRSKNKRSGWYTGAAFESISQWAADVNHVRDSDKLVFQETQEPLCCLESEKKERAFHNFSRRFTEEEEYTTETVEHPYFKEWPLPNDALVPKPASYYCSDTESDLAVNRSISNHISSIVLNLKVSQVLLQQAEKSLDNAEEAQVNDQFFDEVDAGIFMSVAGVNNEKEGSGGAGKALGPPSRIYIPKLTIEDVDESQYSSAQEDSFDSRSYPRTLQEEKYHLKSVERSERGQQQTGYQKSDRICIKLEPLKDSTYQPLGGKFQKKPTWNSEVSEVVALMARGRLRTQLNVVGSSDSEDVEEQQLHLQDWQGHILRYNSINNKESETRGSSDLERLFKSFAGIESDSKESTNFHTLHCTFDVDGHELGATGQTEVTSSESDYAESPIEPNTVYYTPKHHLSDSSIEEKQHSQSLCSDDELDVTIEICQPSLNPTEGKPSTENNECQPAQDSNKTEAESIPPVQSSLPDMAELADLSSIPFSPTQNQEWVGPSGAPLSSPSRGHPPCNSTPRSPRGRRTYLRNVPHLQTLDTLPFSSVPSQTVCTESNGTATSEDSSTTNVSGSSIVQSPAVRDVSKENTESPSSANAEFTTASSGARQTTESSQGTSEEMECHAGESGIQSKEQHSENISCPSVKPVTSDQPPNSLRSGEEDRNGVYEEEDVDEKLLDSQQQSCDDQEYNNEDILEARDGCGDETPDQVPNPVVEDVESNANSHKSTDKSSDDTERANSTLDEDLQRILLERAAELRISRALAPGSQLKAGLSQSDMLGEGYTNIEIAESVNELGEKLRTADQADKNHSNRVLRQIPVKCQS